VAPLAVEVVEIVGSPSPPAPQPERERNRTPKTTEQVRLRMYFGNLTLAEVFILGWRNEQGLCLIELKRKCL
jgi:hypothetical protein